jgi:hypothetical protein
MFIRYFEEQDMYRALRYSITVNTATKKITLLKDGKVFKTYPIAIGKPTDPIPTFNTKTMG